MIHDLAGVVGVDPGPFTLRELAWMAEGRQRSAWDHTSLMVATTLNSRPGVKRRQLIDARRLHPYRKPKRRPVDGDTGERLLTKALGAPSRT